MKILFDATKCNGYGLCADICPSMFKIDEFGFPEILRHGEVPEGDLESATKAVKQCPTKAITLAPSGA